MRIDSQVDVASWITGLMRHNYDAVGFIPNSSVRDWYVRKGHYILQRDERGRPVGYLLHGVIKPGKPCVVSQHCIEFDKRLKGYGQQAVKKLFQRCQSGGATSITLRVAEDLPSVNFWRSCGFSVYDTVPGGDKRQRVIIKMRLLLDLPLLKDTKVFT